MTQAIYSLIWYIELLDNKRKKAQAAAVKSSCEHQRQLTCCWLIRLVSDGPQQDGYESIPALRSRGAHTCWWSKLPWSRWTPWVCSSFLYFECRESLHSWMLYGLLLLLLLFLEVYWKLILWLVAFKKSSLIVNLHYEMNLKLARLMWLAPLLSLFSTSKSIWSYLWRKSCFLTVL